MLNELITELERADGGSRKLNARVGLLVGTWHWPGETYHHYRADDGYGAYHFQEPEPYTTSLDAAITLVPKGWGFLLDCTVLDEPPRAVLCRPPSESVECPGSATPALALCIAALKARNEN